MLQRDITKFQNAMLCDDTDNNLEGERIETKIQRILQNKEPISDGAPEIYTERKDGVLPAYNIRTDRFDIAIEAMDKVNKTQTAKRENKIIDINANKNEETSANTSDTQEPSIQ